MRTSLCLVFTTLFYFINCQSLCKSPNTGSVLFRTIDLYRRNCWRQEELAMTYARRAMVELVPKQIPHNVQIIQEYISICMTTLKEVAKTDEVYDFMVAALADTFGGYLQTYGFPLLHESYYEGYVSYETAKDFHQMMDDFKLLLMTNGDGWKRPMEVRKHINKVLPLKMPTALGKKPCSLLMYDNSSQKVLVSEIANNDHEPNSLIPLPIIDDSKHLSTIALPFKNRALYSLRSKHSYDILIKYYIEATRCLSMNGKNKEGLLEFNQKFSNWLKSTVITHLKDKYWYVGFSNVLRIQETVQQESGMIASRQGSDVEEDSLFTELEKETQLTTSTYFIIILILILSIIVLCFLYWSLIKSCLMCCRAAEPVSARSQYTTETDRSLLSAIEDDEGDYPGSLKCKHQQNMPDLQKYEELRPVTVSEESTLAISCGLGKGFPGSGCRKHRH